LVNAISTDQQERNYFCIIANGEMFDVDKYVRQSALKIDFFWRRGERRPNSETVYENSGVEISLGCGAELDPHEQQPIAVAYIAANKAHLAQLRSSPGITTFCLGLQETVYSDSLGSIMDLSPALMEIALEIKIQITIWSCLSRTPFFNPGGSTPDGS
jgi:hypothetical protein